MSREDAPLLEPDPGEELDEEYGNGGRNEQPPSESLSPEEAAILTLMKRLRFLFGLITLPIVPLGALASFSLLWFVFTAFVLDYFSWLTERGASPPQTCSHPLRTYAGVSLVLLLYTPFHGRVRDNLTSRSFRGRTVLSAHRADQIFHTVALIYVYAGMTLLQTCRDDTPRTISLDAMDAATNATMNSCRVTCPRLTHTFTLYVKTLGLFTLAIMLPLLCLPCIYLWFLRQATNVVSTSGGGGPAALAALQQRLRNEHIRGIGVSATDETTLFAGVDMPRPTAEQVWRRLRNVKLVRQVDDATVLAKPLDDHSDAFQPQEYSLPVECCICMTAFPIREFSAVSSANIPQDMDGNGLTMESDEAIVQTVGCRHLFHRDCIKNWIFGQTRGRRLRSSQTDLPSVQTDPPALPSPATLADGDEENAIDASVTIPSTMTTSPLPHRAKRTTCPLCRTELVPKSDETLTSRYSTFD